MTPSLYIIEDSLQQLAEARATAEDEGDSAAIAEIDKALSEYLTCEVAKVTSYVGLIRSREDTVEACERELARIKAMRDQAQADIDRLKSNALTVMQRFGIKQMKAMPGGGLRRQGNGGLQPLDIPAWPKDGSGQFKMQRDTGLPLLPGLPVIRFYVPNTEAIREALRRGEQIAGVKLLERGEQVRVI